MYPRLPITRVLQSDVDGRYRDWDIESIQDDYVPDALRLCHDLICPECNQVIHFNELHEDDEFYCDWCGADYQVTGLLPFDFISIDIPSEFDYSYNDF